MKKLSTLSHAAGGTARAMYRSSAWLHACLVLSLVPSACASDENAPDDPASLRTLHGVLQLRNDRPPDVRVAVAWRVRGSPEQPQRSVTQDIAVQQTWPMLFTLDLADPPPEAISVAAIQAQEAVANIVAYRDANHNEQLDLTPIGADAVIDPLVAVAGHLTLHHVQGELSRFVLCDSIEFSACRPISAPITLREVTDPRTSCHLLDWTPQFVVDELSRLPKATDPWFVELPECPADAPPTAATRLACDAVGDSYVASWTAQPSAFIQDLCGPVVRVCQRRRDLSQPLPDGWPCPCDQAKYQCTPPSGGPI